MMYYGYDAFYTDTKQLIALARDYQPDAIIAVARGGLILGQLMGYGLGIRNLQSIRVEAYDDTCRRMSAEIFGSCDLSGVERVLLVDDIVDSGMTMAAVLASLHTTHPQVAFKSASIFYKSTASMQPDFTIREATEWIEFFWERDYSDL